MESTNQVADVLRRIVERRRERLAEVAPDDSARREAAEAASGGAAPLAPAGQPFLAALAARRGHAVIAEVKMGSPRIGSLAGRFDPEAQARLYAEHGAAALSVVVEPDFFGGSYELLARCRTASGLPAIAKDFVVDPVQLVWARRAGASAALLVAALYRPEELARLAALARTLGLVPLVELHDHADLDRLRAAGDAWELVGVNNRDLRTFEVDLDHSIRLLPELPEGALKVAESGIGSGADAGRLRAAGFDAFLVGESLLTGRRPGALLEEIAG